MYDYLISREANVNVLDNLYKTVLHYAVEKKDVEAIKYFLSKEADINAKGIYYLSTRIRTLLQHTQLLLVYLELFIISLNMELR